MIKIPQSVSEIIERLWQSGYEAYAVGGCVRDALLGLTPHDWDITTSAAPEEMRRCFEGFRLIETGLKHGTLTVMLRGQGYEVTTFRIDGAYTDHRRPDSVAFVKELSLDLARRDFTINAMATRDGTQIIDLYGGQEDLAKGLLRCVGVPRERFTEDALRILRALRFASVYDLQLDPQTLAAAVEMCDTLSNVSAERIFVELKKLLSGKAARRILLEVPQVLFAVLPELSPMFRFAQNNPHHAYDVWTHTAISVENAPNDPAYRLAMLFHDSGKPRAHTVDADGVDHFKLHQIYSAEIAEECLLRLKSDTATLRQVLFLVREHDLRIPATAKAVKKQMLRLGQNDFMSLFPVFRADLLAQNPALIPEKQAHVDELYQIAQEVVAHNACVSLKQLAVNGSMLKSLGISGKQTGEVLRHLLEAVALNDYPNEAEALLRLARSWQKADQNAD